MSRPTFDPNVLSSKDRSYPEISVVIPSYNQGRFLERTILSVLNQNYPNTELIIIDGGSRDGSVRLIKKYERFISYWVSEPDKGQSNAINKGFEESSGELMAWQNSDDLYLPGFFYTVAETYRAHPRSQLLFGNIYHVDKEDRIIWRSRFVPFSVDHLIFLDWNLSSQATFLKRQLVEEVGPLREDIHVGFDWDWFIRAGRVVKHSVLHKAYGGCYRVHPASKLMTYSQDSRWPIDVQILRSHGVRVTEELTYNQQPWWQARLLRVRMIGYVGLLYSSSIPQYLRSLILRFLESRGTLCTGFEQS